MNTPHIRFTNLTLKIGGEDRKPLDGDLSLLPGKRVAIVGPSGCGKTTLFNALLGRGRPSGGGIEVGGHPAGSSLAMEWLAGNAGVMFQRDALFDGKSVRFNLRFPFRYGRKEAVQRVVGSADPDIEPLLAQVSLPAGRKFAVRKTQNLSGGQHKRVSLARALALAPKILILDEPTSGLDSDTIGKLAETINKMDCSVFCITHDRKFAESIGCEILTFRVPDSPSPVGTEAETSGRNGRLAPGPSPVRCRPKPDFRVYPLNIVKRFCSLFVSGSFLCIPVALLSGAGLVAQSVLGPPWLQGFLPEGITAAVFLGLGTIVPTLLIIGLCGSGVAGELAQRKNSDQLEYLRVIGVSRLFFLLAPVFIGMFLAMPLLIWVSEYFMFLGGRAALTLMQHRSRLTGLAFWDRVCELVRKDPSVIWRSGVKGLTHGAIIGIVSCLCGLKSSPGEAGIRRAIYYSVLISSLLIIGADLFWSLIW